MFIKDADDKGDNSNSLCPTAWHNCSFTKHVFDGSEVDNFVVENSGGHECAGSSVWICPETGSIIPMVHNRESEIFG
jgi:hypothetical protein